MLTTGISSLGGAPEPICHVARACEHDHVPLVLRWLPVRTARTQHTHTRTRTQQAADSTRPYIRSRAYKYTHAQTDRQTDARMHACIHTLTYARMYACTHAHTCKHTNMHARAHKRTCAATRTHLNSTKPSVKCSSPSTSTLWFPRYLGGAE